MNIRALSVALLSISLISFSAVADNHGMSDKKTVAELVETSPQHTTLETALEKAGVLKTLNGKGQYTLLAPTDEAFDALPEGTLDSLLKPENIEKLKAIAEYHTYIGADIPASTILVLIEAGDTRGSLTMMNGEQLYINKEDDGTVTLEDGKGNKVNIISADYRASNGIVHVIDAVLMP